VGRGVGRRRAIGSLWCPTLRPGDHVIVIGQPGRNPEDHRLRMINIKRPSDGWTWKGTFD